MTFEHYTIQRCGPDGSSWVVYGHGSYEPGSVLEGQPRRVAVGYYDTLDDARLAYPRADLVWAGDRRRRGRSLADLSGLSKALPEWFDHGACGERWDDDY